MKLTIAILAVLALVGSAMAWEINDQLEYAYTKSMYQQAGADIVAPSLVGAKSQASFSDPATSQTWGTGAQVKNELTGLSLDRTVWYPTSEDLSGADFAAVLSQGGDATVATHAMNSFDNSIPEMVGEANAYQNLQLLGGFGGASANFFSDAKVGVDGDWTETRTQGASAYVSSDNYGGGEIGSIYMGEQVTSGITKNWLGSGWATPSYSGGISMWAGFEDACDPGCTNPIVSSVSGTAWTGTGIPDSGWTW